MPSPYKGQEVDSLIPLGLALTAEELGPGRDRVEQFLRKGLVSVDRTMVVMFCDLKGSTAALNRPSADKEEFRTLQDDFFCGCTKAIIDVNTDRSPTQPRAVVDKYMGDAAMIYVDVGNTEKPADANPESKFNARKREATERAVRIIKSITKNVSAMAEKHSALLGDSVLGARFGITLGPGVILSVLGCGSEDDPSMRAVGDFTLTGPIVNFAARLEHASPAEFMECIAQSRRQIESYTSLLWERERLRSTKLGEELLSIDTQVAELYEICRKRFEIRADTSFAEQYENSLSGYKLPWKKLPFAPKGFSGLQNAMLLGGNTVAELLRRI